jgi:hypothetical protein
MMPAGVYRAAQNLMVRSTSAIKIATHRGIKKVIIAWRDEFVCPAF